MGETVNSLQPLAAFIAVQQLVEFEQTEKIEFRPAALIEKDARICILLVEHIPAHILRGRRKDSLKIFVAQLQEFLKQDKILERKPDVPLRRVGADIFLRVSHAIARELFRQDVDLRFTAHPDPLQKIGNRKNSVLFQIRLSEQAAPHHHAGCAQGIPLVEKFMQPLRAIFVLRPENRAVEPVFLLIRFPGLTDHLRPRENRTALRVAVQILDLGLQFSRQPEIVTVLHGNVLSRAEPVDPVVHPLRCRVPGRPDTLNPRVVVCLHDLPRCIGGTVVNDDQLKIPERLRKHAVHAGTDKFFMVVTEQQYRNFRHRFSISFLCSTQTCSTCSPLAFYHPHKAAQRPRHPPER